MQLIQPMAATQNKPTIYQLMISRINRSFWPMSLITP